MLAIPNQALILHSIYLGVIVALMLSNSMFAFTLRETNYCYYVGFIAFLGGAQTLENKFFYEFFGPILSPWSLNTWPILMGISLSFAYLFVRRFLRTKENLPIFNSLLVVLLVISLLTSVIAAIFPQWFLLQLMKILLLVWAVLAIYAGVRRWRQNFRPARFYLLAWICLAVASFEGLSSDSTEALNVEGITWSIYLSSLLAVVLLALALIDFLNASRQKSESTLRERLAEAEKVMRLTDLFNRFVPHSMIQCLPKKHIIDVRLGDYVQQEMSVLSMEIQNYPVLSAGLSPPDNLDFVNQFLNEMGPVVGNHNGFVGKYKATGITAFFPDKPEDAIAAGRKMLKRVKQLNQDKKANDTTIEIGIGVNCEVLLLGIVGEVGRMEGAVISDAEIVAVHLQALTKSYQRPFLITEYTLAALVESNNPLIEFVDRVQVPGKSNLIDIFEVKKKPWD